MTQFRLYTWVPVYFRRGAAWPVSYYALFQGMAASEPTSWLSLQLYLLNHLVYIWDLNWRFGLFPFWPWILALIVSLPDKHYRHSEFDIVWYNISSPAQNQCSTSCKIILTLCLNAFRGEPASSWFDWHFTPNHNSSTDFSTSVGSDLHVVLPTLHPDHG